MATPRDLKATPRDSKAGSRCIADVVEDLGFGLAQVQLIIFSYGVWLSGAFSIGLGVLLTVFVANHDHFSNAERAGLATISSAGLVVGSGCGGPLADYLGRRAPILLCYLLASTFGIATVCSSNFWWLSILSFGSCFAISLGFPPSIALVSETIPAKYRVVMQACRSVFYASGLLLANAILIVDDPTYKNMHWRTIFIGSSVPGFLMVFISWIFLYESPVFLAKTGQHEHAREVLQMMRRLNGKPNVDISYSTDEEVESQQQTRTQQLTLAERWKVVFGPSMFATTITLMFVSFTLNSIVYGHMYAFPLIATNEIHSTVAPAYQTLMQGISGTIVIFVSIPLSVMISRRALLTLGLLVGICGMSALASSGSMMHHSQPQDNLFFAGQMAPGACGTFGFLIVYQLAVDAYPVQVASTAAGVILMTGKTGALAAPFLFTVWENWWNFYYLLVVFASISLVLSLAVLSFTPWKDEEAAEKADEVKPLLRKVI
jgi:MFS family permease